MPPDDALHAEPDQTPSHGRPWPRRILRVLGRSVAGVATLGLGLLLLLQTPWGARTAARWIAQQANPFTNATIQVGNAGGTWLYSLALYDVNLVPTAAPTDTTRWAHIDTVRVRYSLPALLRGRLHLQEVTVAGPAVRLRQRADSSWVLPEQPPTPPTAPDTAGPALAIQIDALQVRRGRLTAQFFAPRRDSTLRVRSLRLGMRDLRYASPLAVRLDTLGLDATLPGLDAPLQLGAAATLTNDRFTLDSLALTSPHSTVRGAGTLRLPPSPDDVLDDVDFALTAAPLALRDVAPFVPGLGLNPAADLRLDIDAAGSGRLLQLRTDAALSTGGTLAVEATVTPFVPTDVEQPMPHPLRYRVDARARNLRTAALLQATTATTTRTSADLQVDLQGPSLSRLSGTVATRVFDTRVAGYPAALSSLQLAFTDGEAALSGSGSFADAPFTLDGTVTPFAPTPRYDVRTGLSALDLAPLAPEAGWSSDLNLQLRVTGRGVTLPEARATARLDVRPSTINRQRIDGGRFTVRLRRDSLQYTARLDVPEGQLSADGQARLADPLTYSIDRGRLTGLNVAAFVGDTTASTLNGTVALSGRGTTPETLHLRTTVQLDDTYYGDYRLHAATLRAALDRGRATLATTADLRGGHVEFAATAAPFAEPITVRTTRGRFRHVDLGSLLQAPTQHSDLNGTFRLAGTLAATDSLGTWTARVAVDTSRLNQQVLHAARFDATLDAGRLQAALALDTPAGRTRLAGYARPFEATPTYALTEGTLEGLDLGALAGVPNARTALTGTLALNGRGTDPATLSLDARLDVTGSRINAAALPRGTVQARVAQGAGTLDGRLVLDQGHMTLAATVRPQDDRPRYRLQSRLDSVNIAALTGIDSLATSVTLQAEVDGVGLDPRTMRLTGRLGSPGSRYGAVRLDTLDARLAMQDGLLRVDTLLAHTNIGTARGGGRIAVSDPEARYTSNFRMAARTTNLNPLRAALGARTLSLDEGRVDARVYGDPGTVRFDVTTTLTNLAYKNLRLADVETRVAGAQGDTTALSALEVRGRIGFLSYGTFSVEDTEFEGRYADQQATFSSALTVDRERTARVAGTADLRPGREHIILETINLRLGPDRWQLLQHASIRYGEAYRISNLLLYSGQQQLAADGTVDLDGAQSLVVTLESVEIGAITDLLGFEGLGGRLSGTLAMQGAAQRPQIDGTLNLGIRSFEKEVGHLQLGVNYDSLRVGVDATLTHVDGSTLTMNGQVPADLRLAATDTAAVMNDPVALTLTAEAFSIGWIDPFVDPALAQNLGGQLDANVSIGGTLDTPALSGAGTLRNGRLDLTDLGTTYDAIDADLSFDGDRVHVRQATLRSGGNGRLRAQGTINLTDLTLGAYDLTVTTTDFLAIDTREYRARMDSDLTVRGSTQQPVVRGTVQVESADIYFATGSEAEADLATVRLTPVDQQIIERRFGIRLTEADTTTFDAYEALTMDLTVEFERDTWIRSRSNPKMNIQFTGNLDVQKEPNADAQVFGTIEVIPERSRVVQFGKEFAIEEGGLTFNGAPTEPVMDLRAVYSVRARRSQQDEVTITLSITGRPETLDLALSSSPPMDTNNILSYLAVGRPADRLISGGTAGGDQSLAQRVALGQAASLVENLAASRLGLDVVRIEPTPDGTIFLTAGQYLSPRFYAAVQQSITDEPGAQVTSRVPDITLEYEFTRWLLLRALYRNPDLRLNLFWEYAY